MKNNYIENFQGHILQNLQNFVGVFFLCCLFCSLFGFGSFVWLGVFLVCVVFWLVILFVCFVFILCVCFLWTVSFFLSEKQVHTSRKFLTFFVQLTWPSTVHVLCHHPNFIISWWVERVIHSWQNNWNSLFFKPTAWALSLSIYPQEVV